MTPDDEDPPPEYQDVPSLPNDEKAPSAADHEAPPSRRSYLLSAIGMIALGIAMVYVGFARPMGTNMPSGAFYLLALFFFALAAKLLELGSKHPGEGLWPIAIALGALGGFLWYHAFGSGCTSDDFMDEWKCRLGLAIVGAIFVVVAVGCARAALFPDRSLNPD
jgi:hypothetical protein